MLGCQVVIILGLTGEVRRALASGAVVLKRESVLVDALEGFVRATFDVVGDVAVVEVYSGQLEVFLNEHILLLLSSAGVALAVYVV